MSLSYRRANRSSWCLGYDSSSSSSASSIGSRPLSSYGSSSLSGSSRLDYGAGSSSYGSSSSRWDYRSPTSDLPTSSRYTPSSSISYRSSSSYGDPVLRRSSYTSSGSVRDVGRRDSGYGESSTSSSTRDASEVGNGSSSYGSLDRRRKASENLTSYRSSSRDEETGREKADSGESGDVRSSVGRRASRRASGENSEGSESKGTTDSESVVVRRRERRRNSQEETTREERRRSDVRNRRSGCDYTDIKEEASDSSVAEASVKPHINSETGNKFDEKLQSYVKDCDEKCALRSSVQKTKDVIAKDVDSNTAKPVHIAVDSHLTNVINDDVFEEEKIELKQISLSASPRRSHDAVKYSRHQATELHASSSLHGFNKTSRSLGDTAENSTANSEHTSSKNSTENLEETKGSVVKPVYSNASPNDTSSSKKTVSSPRRFAKEEDISVKGKSSASQDTSGGLVNGEELNVEDPARKPRVNGTVKSATSTTNHSKSGSTTSSAAQKEIIRLESLCEARTKELTHTKMQLKATTQGFDAMAVLVNYCCAELNAFECPTVAKKLETVQKQLTDCMSQIADLSAQKETLNQNLSQVTQEKDEASKRAEEALSSAQKEREEHARQAHELDDTHNAALTTQRDELSKKHDEALKKLRTYYDKQIDLMKQAHDRQISDVKNESKLEMNGIRISHLEEIQELRNKHDAQMEELHKQHRNKLEDITHRFESIKLTLSEKVESLRGECDELGKRARNSEEALQRDADVKVQIALAPYLNLPKEIESLKTVLEMRNEEIQKLRSKNMDLEKQLEEIPIAREKIISLQQKVENLEAIINIKTDHEKQLHEKCQVLMRKYDRESRANKRLSMDYEQVMWRMSQSSEFGSCESLSKRHLSRSPPRSEASSPDPRRRTLSPNDVANGEVVMRVKKRNSNSLSEGDRKLRSRSATFVVEKEESNESRSPSSSPQLKQKRWRKKSQTEELAEREKMERMCHSAGAELMSEVQGQQKKGVELKEKVAVKAEMTDSQEGSDMASSYARSISGVSDSGVYDSMTRSDMLNSSIVSTDSEWAMTSANLSMTLDSTMDDLESGPQAGDYCMLNEKTLIQGKNSQTENDTGSTSSSTDPVQRGSQGQNDTNENSKNCSSYEFQVSLPDGADDVFNESFTMDGSKSTSDSDEAVSGTTAKSKSLSGVTRSHDPATTDASVSLSQTTTTTHAEVASSPSISCPDTS